MESNAKRFARVLRLRPGAREAYERYHREIWPEIVDLIRSVGIRNYSVFHYRDWLFSYFELPPGVELAEVSKALSHSEAAVKWESLMQELQEPLPESGGASWWVPMNELWHLDDRPDGRRTPDAESTTAAAK